MTALAICLIILEENKRKKWNIAIIHLWMLFGLVIYLFGLLSLYLYSFPKYEAAYLSSFSRYMGTYFIGWSVVMFGILFNAQNKILKYFLLIFLTFFLFMISPSISYKFLFYSSTTLSNQGLVQVRVQIRRLADFMMPKIKMNKRIYVIWQNAPAFLFHIFQYEMIPLELNDSGWSLGKASGNIDFWTRNLSPQTFLHNLKRYDYVLFVGTDEEFQNKYGKLFAVSENRKFLHHLNGLFEITGFSKGYVLIKSVPNSNIFIQQT